MQTEQSKILDPLVSTYGQESALQLLEMFFKQAVEVFQRIDQAIVQHDSKHLEAAAHYLKGSVSALGLSELAVQAKTIENNAGDFIVCTNEFAKMQTEYCRLQGLFKGLLGSIPVKNYSPGKIKLVVVEDNNVTRQAIICLLSKNPDFEILGDCEDGIDAVELVRKVKPDLAIFDIELPGMNGIDAVQRIKSILPETKALMLTAHDSDEKLFASFAAGAEGYLLKSNFNKQQLELAIRTVAGGNCWLDPVLAQRVLQSAEESRRKLHAEKSMLSSEEEKILQKVANPAGNCENGVCTIDPSFLTRLQRLNPDKLKAN